MSDACHCAWPMCKHSINVSSCCDHSRLSLHLGVRGALSEEAMLSQPQDRGKETTTCKEGLGAGRGQCFESRVPERPTGLE